MGWNASENLIADREGAWAASRSAMPGEPLRCRAAFQVEGGREYTARGRFSPGVSFGAVTALRRNGVPVNASVYTLLTGQSAEGAAFEVLFSSRFSDSGATLLEIEYTVALNDKASDTNSCGVVLTGGGETMCGPEAKIDYYGFSVYRAVAIPDKEKQSNPLQGACYCLYTDARQEHRVAFTDLGGGVYLACGQQTCGHSRHAFLLRTESTGRVVLRGLPQGTYWLSETRTPQGYTRAADGLEIVVTETGRTYAGGVPLTDDTLRLIEQPAPQAGKTVKDPAMRFYETGCKILSMLLTCMFLARRQLFR